MKNIDKNFYKNIRGITLVALVITIVVLIILATVSINIALSGGLLDMAKSAENGTNKSYLIETVQQEILGEIIENKGDNLSDEQLHDILVKYFENVPDVYKDNEIKSEKREEWVGFPENFPKLKLGEKEIGIEEIIPGIVGGLTAEEIKSHPEEYYGSYVEYGIDLNKDGDYTNDWRIFYVGGEDDGISNGYIFLIAGNPVLNELTEKSRLKAGLTQTSKKYGTWWEENQEFQELDKLKINPTQLFMHTKFALNKNTEYANQRYVSTLLNTDNWTEFVNKDYYGLVAIGSPTLEMWCASWNSVVTDSDENGFKQIRIGTIIDKRLYFIIIFC